MYFSICFAFLFSTSYSYTTTPKPDNYPKGLSVANLDKDYDINIVASPVYPDYREAKAKTDYIDREMSKLGTSEIPNFKPIKASEQIVY